MERSKRLSANFVNNHQMAGLTGAVESARGDPPSKPGNRSLDIMVAEGAVALLATFSERYIREGEPSRFRRLENSMETGEMES